MSDLWEFLRAVFWHWQGWLGGSGVGGAVVVFVALYERLSGHTMGKHTYVTVFVIAFLFGACYMAWLDQNKRTTKAEAQIETLCGSGKLVLQGIGLGFQNSNLPPQMPSFKRDCY